jgi:hypothetical protein
VSRESGYAAAVVPDVNVTQNVILVYAAVLAMGALIVLSVAFSVWGARVPKLRPDPPGPPDPIAKPAD